MNAPAASWGARPENAPGIYPHPPCELSKENSFNAVWLKILLPPIDGAGPKKSIEASAVSSWKTESPIETTPAGIVIPVRAGSYWKALEPMEVTVSGSVIDVSEAR